MNGFGYGKAQEAQYAKNLRKIARQVDLIAKNSPTIEVFTRELEAYTATLDPVAEGYATKMLNDASKRNITAWVAIGEKVGKDFRKLLTSSSTAYQIATRLAEQVATIKTIPLSAATKAQALAVDAVKNSLRADDITAEIAKIGGASEYEATRIARTEIAKTNAGLTAERSREVGCDEYIWRCVSDSNSRESHAEMDGELCRFSNPPVIDGEQYNAGEIYNCRCFAEPVIK